MAENFRNPKYHNGDNNYYDSFSRNDCIRLIEETIFPTVFSPHTSTLQKKKAINMMLYIIESTDSISARDFFLNKSDDIERVISVAVGNHELQEQTDKLKACYSKIIGVPYPQKMAGDIISGVPESYVIPMQGVQRPGTDTGSGTPDSFIKLCVDAAYTVMSVVYDGWFRPQRLIERLERATNRGDGAGHVGMGGAGRLACSDVETRKGLLKEMLMCGWDVGHVERLVAGCGDELIMLMIETLRWTTESWSQCVPEYGGVSDHDIVQERMIGIIRESITVGGPDFLGLFLRGGGREMLLRVLDSACNARVRGACEEILREHCNWPGIEDVIG